MGQLYRSNRDLSVERMLLDGGFNPKTILAVNDVIRARVGERHNPAPSSRAVPAAYDRARASR